MTVRTEELLIKNQLTYKEMQQLASHEEVTVRRALAKREDLLPEVLYFLAEDHDAQVRQTIAQNPTTPRQADLLLANDEVETVRFYLSEKIARLAPDSSDETRDKIKDLTHEALIVLSKDQAVRVRQVLSETLKDVINAPSEVIIRLARDLELVVAGPVLQYSPVLTDEDLLEIISSSHADGALNAISKRPSVSEIISEAVIATQEESAIADLLANEKAQIREDTLDMLVEQAEHKITWHKPLVHRPKLSQKAATNMAQYLAENLLDHLKEREDLPEDVISAVRIEVQKRLNPTNDESAEEEVQEEFRDPMEDIEEMFKNGELTTENVEEWLNASRELHVLSALAVLSKMRRVKVKKIISSQSGKGIMALVWRAGLEPRMNEEVQLKLAKVPVNMLFKLNDEGEFPLSEDELSWHLEMFGDD